MADLQVMPSETAFPSRRLDPERRFLGLTDAAKRVGLSRAYVHQLTMSGRLPAYRVGRRLLIDVDDLDAFIRKVPA